MGFSIKIRNPFKDVSDAVGDVVKDVKEEAERVTERVGEEIERIGEDVVAETERAGETIGPAQYLLPVIGQTALARDIVMGKGPVGDVYDWAGDVVDPDFPDFPDTMSQFLGAAYEEEEEEDEIEFGGTGLSTKGSKESTVREKAPTRAVSTGLSIGSGGGGVKV
jgi:hypothetical protein